jgi:hypothetical protein
MRSSIDESIPNAVRERLKNGERVLWWPRVCTHGLRGGSRGGAVDDRVLERLRPARERSRTSPAGSCGAQHNALVSRFTGRACKGRDSWINGK